MMINSKFNRYFRFPCLKPNYIKMAFLFSDKKVIKFHYLFYLFKYIQFYFINKKGFNISYFNKLKNELIKKKGTLRDFT